MMTNGQLLKQKRRAVSVSQTELAKRANITRQTLVDLEQGRLGMTAEDYAAYLSFINELSAPTEQAADLADVFGGIVDRMAAR